MTSGTAVSSSEMSHSRSGKIRPLLGQTLLPATHRMGSKSGESGVRACRCAVISVADSVAFSPGAQLSGDGQSWCRGDARKRRRSDSFPQATVPFACLPPAGGDLQNASRLVPSGGQLGQLQPCHAMQPRAPAKVARRVPPKIRPLGTLALDVPRLFPARCSRLVRWCVGEEAPGCRALAGDWLDGRLWEKAPGGKKVGCLHGKRSSYRRRIQSLERIVESNGRTGLRDGMEG